MNVLINAQARNLPEAATVQDAIAASGVQAPFAVAVNTEFVPRSNHASYQLQEGDRVDIIVPVTGG